MGVESRFREGWAAVAVCVASLREKTRWERERGMGRGGSSTRRWVQTLPVTPRCGEQGGGRDGERQGRFSEEREIGEEDAIAATTTAAAAVPVFEISVYFPLDPHPPPQPRESWMWLR